MSVDYMALCPRRKNLTILQIKSVTHLRERDDKSLIGIPLERPGRRLEDSTNVVVKQ
jgi:hypothetical protein